MMRLGIISPSNIAEKRFLPALSKIKDIEFVAIAINSISERYDSEEYDEDIANEMMTRQREKAKRIVGKYGGKIVEGYKKLIESDIIDAVYIPLPPSLHYKWAKYAIQNKKHILLEKPSTINLSETKELIDLSIENDIAIHENYMFEFHNQIKEIDNILAKKIIGEIRQIRICFGFPKRADGDFRYDKKMGGGALFDAGGYTLKYATHFLGDTARIEYSNFNKEKYDVDLYGIAILSNEKNDFVQVSFGMDNDYKCELEVWGSEGTLYTNRILTAPEGFIPTVTISKNGEKEELSLSSDDTFFKSINYFVKCINDEKIRNESRASILKQSILVDDFIKKTNNNMF